MPHFRPLAARVRTLPLVAGALMLNACAAVGGGSYPQVAGVYEGRLSVEGQGIPGELEILQDGAMLEVRFVSPELGLAADGEGSLDRDRSARLTIEYDLQCPGEALLRGEFTRDGRGFSGTVEASDCTGEVSGTFSFRR